MCELKVAFAFLCCWKPMLMGYDLRFWNLGMLMNVLGHTCVPICLPCSWLCKFSIWCQGNCWCVLGCLMFCICIFCFDSFLLFLFCFWFVEFYGLPVFYVFVICRFQWCVLTSLNVVACVNTMIKYSYRNINLLIAQYYPAYLLWKWCKLLMPLEKLIEIDEEGWPLFLLACFYWFCMLNYIWFSFYFCGVYYYNWNLFLYISCVCVCLYCFNLHAIFNYGGNQELVNLVKYY